MMKEGCRQDWRKDGIKARMKDGDGGRVENGELCRSEREKQNMH